MRFSKCDEVVFTSLGMPHNYENQRYFLQTLFMVAPSNQIGLEDMMDNGHTDKNGQQ